MGIKQLIDFIVFPRTLCLFSSSATDLLESGSDHTAMRATYIIESEHHNLHMACIEWKGVDRDWIFADVRLQTMRCYMLKLDMGHSYASAERNKLQQNVLDEN